MIEEWEAYEDELHRLLMEAECEMMAEELTRLDVDVPFVVIDGKVHYGVLRTESTYEGIAGDIRVERTLLPRVRSTACPVVPMELRAGIVEGHWTPLANNLPIGSGVVEAACKTLVTQRLKRSGMCWGIDGGQTVLTFRALAQSDRFDNAWRLVSQMYKKDISLPGNIVPLPVRNRA